MYSSSRWSEPNNFFINRMVDELILKRKVEGKEEVKCDECDEDEPVVAYITVQSVTHFFVNSVMKITNVIKDFVVMALFY